MKKIALHTCRHDLKNNATQRNGAKNKKKVWMARDGDGEEEKARAKKTKAINVISVASILMIHIKQAE